jgi:hypothetical protein
MRALEEAREEGPTPVERVNLVLGAVHRLMGSTRLLDGGGAPVGGNWALEPAAFEQMIAELPPDHRFAASFRGVLPFGHLSYFHAALNREVEEVLAFVAAGTPDATDADDDSYAVSYGFNKYLRHLFCYSPWPYATYDSAENADLELDCGPLRESIRLAIRRAGIRECLVEEVLKPVGRLVVTYTNAILTYWEATEIAEQDDDDAGESDDVSEDSDEEESDEDWEEAGGASAGQ